MPYRDDILPDSGHDGYMLQNVAFVVLDRFPSFEFGVVCEVFGVDRTGDGLPAYDFAVVAGEDGPLHSEHGLALAGAYGMERLAEADLVVVSAIDEQLREGVPREFPASLLRELRAAVARGAQVLSVCTGAFVLAAAGLLDGRRCTTHWMYAADLARYCPAAKVDPDVLYVDAHPVITSAGSAAGIDACLYVVRREQGTKVANQIARRMVVAPHRDGGQAQFVDRPLPAEPADTLAEVTGWLERHLDQQVTVAELPGQPAQRRGAGLLHEPPGSGFCSPSGCSRTPRRPWTGWPSGPGSAMPWRCATISARGAAPPRPPTGAPSVPARKCWPGGALRLSGTPRTPMALEPRRP